MSTGDDARSGDLRALASLFGQAALEPELWPVALDAFAAATRSEQAQLVGFGPRFGGFNWVNHAPSGMLEAFTEVEREPDLNFRIKASQQSPRATVVFEKDYDAARPLLSGDSYLDLCNDWDILYGCQTDLVATSDRLVGMALLRTRRDGPTDAAARETFAAIRPAARAAVALQSAVERGGHQLVAGALEAVGAACFVLDRSWRAGAMTPMAELLIEQGHFVLVDGRPLPRDGSAARKIVAHSRRILSGRAAGAELIAHTAQGPMRITLSVLPPRDWQLGFGPYALMTAKPSSGMSVADIDRMRAAFGLTNAEAAVAQLMLAGHRRDAIARMRGTSAETLRSQMRNIFAKLGVRREADAIGVLHTLFQ